MPSPPADAVVTAIKQAVNIVDLIGEKHSLTRRGRTFKGICPFHDDHTPSLDVDPQRQRYRCWSCGAAGDIFDYVMNHDRVGFREALETLAQRAQITLPKDRVRSTENPKQELFEILAWAEEEFHSCLLRSDSAKPARQYVAKRGLSNQSIESFRLGFTPNEWEWLIQRSRARRFTPEALERAGLAKRRQRGPGFYDLFRGRLMFPIRDARGRTIAFGGRILPEHETDEQPKYVNSPETPVFTKGEHLYGLDRARDAIAKTKCLVVVEGYTDCIMAHQHGLTHVVGTLGTALGDSHVNILKRFTDKIFLAYDGDDAGQRAADRVLSLILSHEVDLRVFSIPGNLDPCDFLIAQGADEFRRGLDSAEPALDFRLRRASQLYDLQAIPGRRQALDAVLESIAALPFATTGTAPVMREMVLDSLSNRLGIGIETVHRRLRELRDRTSKTRVGRQTETSEKSSGIPTGSDASKEEQELLEILLADPSCVERVAENVRVDEFKTPVFRRIFEVCIEVHRDGLVLDVDSLRLRLEDRDLACRASILAETGREKGLVERRLADVLAYYERRRLKADEQSRAVSGENLVSEDDKKQFLSRHFNRALTRQGKTPRHAMTESP